MKKKTLGNKGTTLIELILYIAITAFLLIDISGILSQLVYNQTKVEVLTREDENARTAMRLISQSVEEAQTINSPNSVNASASTLNITDNSNNTIIYTLTSGVVTKQINNGTAVAITGNDVYVSTLTFTVESEAGLSPSINIKLEIQQSASNSNSLTHYETTAAQRKQ